MTTFNTQNKKLLFCWNQNQKNKNLISQQLIINKEITHELSLAERGAYNHNNLIDLSSEWQAFNNVGTNYFVNFQIIFDRIDIRLLNFLQSHFVYVQGDPDSEILTPALFFGGDFTINEVMQIIDIPGVVNEFQKKVIWNKSILRDGSINEEYKIKLVCQLYNGLRFI